MVSPAARNCMGAVGRMGHLPGSVPGAGDRAETEAGGNLTLARATRRWVYNKAGGGRCPVRAPKRRGLSEEGHLSCDMMEVR